MIDRDVVVGDLIIDSDFSSLVYKDGLHKAYTDARFKIYRVVSLNPIRMVVIGDGTLESRAIKIHANPKTKYTFTDKDIYENHFLCTKEIMQRRINYEVAQFTPLMDMLD